ncbi:MAG: hypothetical protein KDA31_09120 [Phycisphaerales bacterium]|nr:hypothetical protein [Phycisphaerales bacterium]
MLDKLLADHKDELITAVTSKLGVGTDQAGTFIQKLLDMAQKLIGKGDLDLSALLKGDVGALKSKLNLDVLGSALGGGADKAEQGLNAVIGPLSQKLGGLGGADDLLAQITGGEGGGLLGKLGGMLGGKG